MASQTVAAVTRGRPPKGQLPPIAQPKAQPPPHVAKGSPTNASLSALPSIAEDWTIPHAVHVTPELAAEWLSNNEGNRNVRQGHVRSLSADMTALRWKLTHQAIAFSTTGRLLDGQHRLHAIIASGVGAPLLIFIGLPDDLFGALDRNMKRTMTDHLMEDGRFVDPCTFLARMMLADHRRAPAPEEVRDVLDLLRPSLVAQMGAAAGIRKGHTSAPTRAMWALRYLSATENGKQLLREQWAAMVNADYPSLDGSTSAGLRRMDAAPGSGRATTASQGQEERACISWIMFDPRKRDLTRLVLKNTAGTLAEIRATIRAAMANTKPIEDTSPPPRQGRLGTIVG
jgi:hypothetical protein